MGSLNSDRMTDRERAIRQRLKSDFKHYASKCLKIRSKSGKVEPLCLNTAQDHIHERLERQRLETGRIRAIILKGRQQGCSTYVEGRFYWRTSHRKGVRAFILTHEQEATDNLFEMATRYHEHCPDLVKPRTGAANAKELHFDGLDSGYRVATAGNKGAGRSSTVQYFHGSEVAYWPNAEAHASGVMQAIPDANDTEVILESTANGQGNYYHQLWIKAQAGEGDFIAIFVPWFWQSEYRRPVSDDFKVAGDEGELIEAFGLNKEQLAWRRAKIQELGGGSMGEQLFHREYPCTPEEAFMGSVEDVVIPPVFCAQAKARNVLPTDRMRPVWGVDVAWTGDDRSALAKRAGNVQLEPVKSWHGKDPMQLAGLVLAEYRGIREQEAIGSMGPHGLSMLPAEIMVDVIGMGAGVYARLLEMGLPAIPVNVAESASVNDRYHRLRDELWFLARAWLAALDSKLCDDDALIGELVAPKYEVMSSGKLRVEGKPDLKKRGIRSPDLADSFILTFAGGNTLRDDIPSDRYSKRDGARRERSWMSA